MLVELFVECNIIICPNAQHSITPIRLVNMIDVMKAVRSKMFNNQRSNIVDGSEFKNTA